MYKLFAVDLDGTLLDQEGRIHPSDQQALRQIQEAGVHLSIITGRLYSGTSATARLIDAHGPVACVDGGHIVDVRTDGDLFHRSVAGAHAFTLRDTLEAHKVACFVFAHNEIVHDAHGEEYLSYVSTWSTRLVRHTRVTHHPHWAHPRGLSEVICMGSYAALEALAQSIAECLSEAVQVATFPIQRNNGEGDWGMIIRAAGSSKGTAVHWLSEYYGCTAQDVVVVGDWFNDLSMFAVAGRSFAMGQAPAEIKEAATDVLESTVHTGGGIAEAAFRAGIVVR